MKDNRLIQIEQIEVKINELVMYIIRKFVYIFAIAILFSISVPLLKYYLSIKMNDKAIGGEQEYENQKLAIYEKQLDEYYRQYETMTDYSENSLLLKLDQDNTYALVIQFIIDTDTENLVDITTAYSNYYSNGNMSEEMKKLSDKNEGQYLEEIIRLNCSTYSNYESSSIINVKIYGDSEEFCKSYSEVIKKVIYDFSAKLNSADKKNEIKILSEEIVVGSFADIKSAKESKIAYIANLETNISNLSISIDEIRNSISVDGKNVATKKIFDLKYVVIGFFGGIVLATIAFCIIYIFSNKIKYAKEISEYTNMLLLGKISNNGTFNKKVNSGYDIDKQVELIINKIQMMYEIENKKINMISVSKDKDKITSVFKNVDIDAEQISVYGDITEDIDTIKRFKNSYDNIVLVMYARHTNYNHINDILKICYTKQSKILGYIYVE